MFEIITFYYFSSVNNNENVKKNISRLSGKLKRFINKRQVPSARYNPSLLPIKFQLKIVISVTYTIA